MHVGSGLVLACGGAKLDPVGREALNGPQWAAFSSTRGLSGLGPAVCFGCARDLSSATSRTDGWPLLCCVYQQLFRCGRVEGRWGGGGAL